jgi:cytochrome c oxidase assembly factor CtaG
VWLVGWYVVHLGPIYDTAVSSSTLLNIEHLFLIAIGLLFWWPVLVDTPNNVPTLGRIGYVFVAFVSSAFLGLALTFAPPIYDHYEQLTTRLWGIGAAKDQNLGGILMSTEQALVFGIAIIWLLLRLLREEEESEERLNEEQRAAGLRPR